MEYISVGRRAAAIIIDAIVLSIVALVIIAVTGDVGTVTTSESSFEFEATGGGLSTALVLLVGFGYFIVLEKVIGATLGKLAVGIRVVGADGSEVSWGASFLRNLMRIVDGFFFYLVGALIVWNSPTRQRLGDKVAQTVVVAKGSVGAAPPTTQAIPPPPPPPPTSISG